MPSNTDEHWDGFDHKSSRETRKTSSRGSKTSTPKANKAKDKGPQNYLIEFPGVDDACPVVIDNKTDAATVMYDAESGEEVKFYFGLLTAKNSDGDLKLVKMCSAMEGASVHHHTYDAKSGANYRMTRLGVTKSRLERFADATQFEVGFSSRAVERACVEKGLRLENPDTAMGRSYYPPYSYLSAPYSLAHKHLYEPLSGGDLLKLCKRLVMGSSRFKGPAKGCSFNLEHLASDERDNAYCLAFFPLHHAQMKQALEEAWMPLDWPWKLPMWGIKEYFGEEVGFYFAFLGHLTSFLVPLAPVAVMASVASASVLSALPDSQNMYPEAMLSVFGT